ncbi:MAG TPA: RNA polymerase sigma factor [Thermohalobaculum sp.]|nr:RNA polymerase sigma factor [Thermohalobaculum sp.]
MEGSIEDAPQPAPDWQGHALGNDGVKPLDENDRSATVGNGEPLLQHIQALRRYANVLVGNHADADDLVQEALKRALAYLDRDRQIENLRAYLFTILHNVRNDALRKRARAGTQVPVEDMPLISEQASETDRIACIQVIQAMQRLSEEHRQVLLLVGVEGMSYRETAEILNLPIGTVMSRLNRARTALRELLGLEGPLEVDRPC